MSRGAFTLICFSVAIGISSCAQKSVYESESDREGIRLVVAQNRDQLHACYLKAIEKRPGAEGKVVMEWDIKPDGSTDRVRVGSVGGKITDVTDCLTAAILKWRFPRLGAEELVTEVKYPFIFSENGDFRSKP